MSFRFPVRSALPSNGSRGARHSGFTLTELVTIIVLVGILAAVALPRFTGRITFDTRGYADQVLGALQYAQKVAVAERRNVCVIVVAGVGGSVSLSKAASAGSGIACTINMINPTTGAASYSISVPNGVTVAASVSGVPTSPIIFDALGQNVNGSGVPRTADFTVTVTGDSTTTITVEKVTGYAR
jgi:MSHA pilin protein MshC